MATASPRSTRSRTPSTPKSTGGSPVHNGSSPAIMTPGRKIKAMLAAFDSDSESDRSIPKPSARPTTQRHARMDDDDDSEEDRDEDLPVAPRGRLAARMHAAMSSQKSPVSENKKKPIPGRQAVDLSALNEISDRPQGSDSDNGDVLAFGRRGRKPTRATELSSPSTPQSNGSERSPSPLFVPMGSSSPADKTAQRGVSISEATPPISRLQALVDEKRRKLEQQEKQSLEKEREKTQRAMELDSEEGVEDDDEEEDDEAVKRLTQQSRPARKASKKAMLDINRETQRMARNMQLAHEATTKKKISIDSFLTRFNQKKTSATSNSGSINDTPIQTSDAEGPHSTPPTSPVREAYQEKHGDKPSVEGTSGTMEGILEEDMEFPTIDALFVALDEPQAPQLEQSQQPLKEITPTIPIAPKIDKTSRRVQVRLSREAIAQCQKHDSDSDLEIVTSPHKARRLALFENITSQNAHKLSNSLRTLKALAHLPSNNKKQPMTRAELDETLLRKAREQAAQQREEKIAALRAKGVVIQTAEERVRGEEEVEDLMDKAREEADQIAKQEKAASKRAKKSNDVDIYDIASDEEEEYVNDAEVNSEAEDSEDLDDAQDGLDDEDREEEQDNEQQPGELFDDQAEEGTESEGRDDDDEAMEEDVVNKPDVRRRNRSKLVVSDDEDDGPVNPHVATTPKPQIPNLGLPTTPLLGLSQVFAATLGGSQEDSQEDSLEQLRKMPGIDLPVAELLDSPSQDFTHETQGRESGTLDIFAGFPEPSTPAADSPSTKTFTEYSQIPDPTQDDGFVMSPFDQQKRFRTAPSTVATSMVASNETGPRKRERKRLRRGPAHQDSDADDDDEPHAKVNAFKLMRKKESKPFAKDKSKAKEMVDEAAEESDDEYAGLGGASDEDSGLEDEFDRQMINDNSGEVVDEKELAAMNAHHEREQDELQVNKLMKDITTGALRRKRVGDALDLSDSDDERISRRRAAKRREFMKMRKALLADEKIGKIAEDPKKQAFMRTIEDMDVDNDSDFLEEGDDSENYVASQESNNNGNDSNQQGTGGDDASNSASRKRPFETVAADALNRLPAKSRRLAHKASMKKPLTLAEIRESVSFLLDGPNTGSSLEAPASSIIPSDDVPAQPDHSGGIEEADFVDNGDPLPASGGEAAQRPKENANPRRQRGKVVDRLALRRQASSNAASAGKPAFHSGANGVGPDFQLPPFLQRRSSSSLSIASTRSSSSSTSSGSSVVVTESAGVQGGRKGAVNYYAAAREKERELQLKKGLKSGSSHSTMVAQRRTMGSGLSGLLDSRAGEWE
ncbi:uncharacterized protein GIQ15_06903 [Arthroderma uncinatum]|uniref:uncharacterized protein n=1 Tax=Arthroderma uncinatum TaxID=74035 RepID=UPI00144A51C4|nr:uncharacterized protein GIQ15_06903 [Arthroderma uncinatum]KAF3479927.1 hypothetical protein GIQ15_06903 [Arthroderma uncinatum]